MIYVIDAAYLINGLSFEEGKEFLTVPGILDEFRDLRTKTLAGNAVNEGKLKSIEPKEEFIEKVNSSTLSARLSEADKELCALALELNSKKKKFKVLTDDYALQNFLSANKISFEPVLMEGIQKKADFEKKCIQCKKKFSFESALQRCDVCGGKITSMMKFK
jgi:rRNA maturation endonuclease Nob1